MKAYINDLLQELNSISRMAVIENALVTEKMIGIHSHILKYRWNEEGKEVTAAKEMDIVRKYCELFRLKHNNVLDFKYTEKSDLKIIFMPHYTIAACIKQILTVMDNPIKPFQLHIEVSQKDEVTWIRFLFMGPIDFEAVLEKVKQGDKNQDYEHFDEVIRRWKEKFGTESFKLELHATNQRQLEMSFSCQ